MANLINVIIQDAKPGTFISKPVSSPYSIPSVYYPRDHQRAVKEIFYCYDNGSIVHSGIGDCDYEEHTDFRQVRFHTHSNFFEEVSELNCWLQTVTIHEFLKSYDKDEFTMRKEDCSSRFCELMEYFRSLDGHTPPQPWNELGFLYTEQQEDDGTYYYIDAIVDRTQHRQIKTITL